MSVLLLKLDIVIINATVNKILAMFVIVFIFVTARHVCVKRLSLQKALNSNVSCIGKVNLNQCTLRFTFFYEFF